MWQEGAISPGNGAWTPSGELHDFRLEPPERNAMRAQDGADRVASAGQGEKAARMGYVGFGSMRAPGDIGRVAAVVHHGGAGTTTTATRAGAPQVVVPQWGDQPYFAGRVAALGIGAAHDVQVPTVPTGRRWPRSCCSPPRWRNGGAGRERNPVR